MTLDIFRTVTYVAPAFVTGPVQAIVDPIAVC